MRGIGLGALGYNDPRANPGGDMFDGLGEDVMSVGEEGVYMLSPSTQEALADSANLNYAVIGSNDGLGSWLSRAVRAVAPIAAPILNVVAPGTGTLLNSFVPPRNDQPVAQSTGQQFPTVVAGGGGSTAQQPTPAPAAAPAAAKDYTPLYVIGGVAVIGVLAFAFSSRGRR